MTQADDDGLVDVEAFLATAAPRTETVPVCARNDLVARHVELAQQYEAALADADRGGGLGSDAGNLDEAEAIAEKILEVQAEQDRFTLQVTLEGIGAKAWADLLRLHPPTKEQRGYAHNPDTFPPAAVAACSIRPKISVGQATQMFETLASAEWTKLWLAAVGLNELETPRPKLAAAAVLLQARRPSAVSPGSGGSPGEPS